MVLVGLFHVGFTGYANGAVAPDDALTLRVRAMQWHWEVEHPGGVIDDLDLLRVPARTPVRLVMSSSDVLHSLFVPAFRLKRDVVPGMYSTMWFEVPRETPREPCERDADCPEGLWCGARVPGDEARSCAIPIFCAEYCGAPVGLDRGSLRSGPNTNHATMMGSLVALPEREYWASQTDPVDWNPCSGRDDEDECWGEYLHQTYCVACHAVDGVVQRPAPNWAGLFGRERTFVDGTSAVADADYIRRSILQPQSQRVAGYESVNMPPFRLSDRQVDAILAYIRSLDEGPRGSSGEGGRGEGRVAEGGGGGEAGEGEADLGGVGEAALLEVDQGAGDGGGGRAEAQGEAGGVGGAVGQGEERVEDGEHEGLVGGEVGGRHGSTLADY
ncbi:MAG: hypothetical protein CMN30_24545 [Sandaracinus sp.]|nr:hypothetical protein [Sandaracinus sp.]